MKNRRMDAMNEDTRDPGKHLAKDESLIRTERKREEENLRRMATVVRDSNDAITIQDFEGRITAWNHGAELMYGYSEEEALLMNIERLTAPEKVAEQKDFVRRLVAGEDVTSFETQRVTRDGRVLDVWMTVTKLMDDASKPIGLASTERDITERKRAADTLREGEFRYRRLLEKAPFPLCHVTKEGVIDFRNERFLDVFGYTADDVPTLAEWWLRAYPDPQYRHWVTADWEGAVRQAKAEGGGIQANEYKVVCKNGEERIVEISGITLGEEFLATFFDLTARKREEENLRRMATVVRDSNDAITIQDFEGRITAWNRGAELMYGYGEAEALLMNIERLTAPEKVAEQKDFIRRLVAGEDVTSFETLRVTQDGRVLDVWMTVTKLMDDAGKPIGLASTERDITERKLLEEQVRASQKMEAIGSLAGGVAHDFNNLLSVILSYTGFAIEGVREGDPMRDDLLEVKKAGERAAVLTRQLLAFSRKQILQPVPLDLNEIVAGIEKMLRRILGEDIDLLLKLTPDIGLTLADPGQIEQVLMNLVVNARDAMPEGGKLTIETSTVEIDEEYAARHVAVKPGPYVQLTVTDTGYGMDQQTKARLFEPFFTTKEKGKGTGLGLSTVYGIVTQSGGKIWVYSELGQGTTFKIYLPHELSATKATPIKPPTVPRRLTGTETILVVEDEEALCQVAKRALDAAGYTVLTARDGKEAILTCAEHVGDIQLLLTDVVMPGMSGRALVQEVLKTRPTLKILYMSGYTDDAIVHHGVLDTGTHFLAKPFTAADLTRKVREVLDEGITNLADGESMRSIPKPR